MEPKLTTPKLDERADVDHFFLPWKKDAPLAARMRPRSLDEFVGQEQILGPGKLLRRAIEADRVGSIILWGPPGSGKTTLARVIAGATRSHFEVLNAVLAGVKEIREVVERARERMKAPKELFTGPRRTTLFVDEVHRFNKAQQDALLPHVENGTLILIGATTENPYFEVIKALVSRSRIFSLERLSREHLLEVARSALADPERGYGKRSVTVEADALEHLVDVAQGDARNLLNALELAVETTAPDATGSIAIDRAVAEESIQRRALLYDKDGDAHYDTISAFIKSLRGSDVDAALFWLARMLRAGEDPRFVARRLVIFASEDVGMADPQSLSIATAAANAVEFVGMPECQWNLSHAVIHLATAPKSNSAIGYFEALKALDDRGEEDVPNPLKDASRDRKGLGHGEGYKYPHAFRDHWVAQQYLPNGLQGVRFYRPSDTGHEHGIKESVERLRESQAGGLEAERLTSELDSGRVRRRKWLCNAFSEANVRLAEEVLSRVEFSPAHTIADFGPPSGLLGLVCLEKAPLGRIHLVETDRAAAQRLHDHLVAEKLDRIVQIVDCTVSAVPIASGSLDLVVCGLTCFCASKDLRASFADAARILKPGGTLLLQEPLLAQWRRLYEEVALSPLGEDLSLRIRDVEEAAFRNAEDPRMTLSEASLEEALRGAGFTGVALERVVRTTVRIVNPDVIARWFCSRRDGSPKSYEERLLERISREELAAYRRLFEKSLLGQGVHRPFISVVAVARKGA